MLRILQYCKLRHHKTKEESRKLRSNDPEFNASFKYSSNYISTSRYTFLNFIPINIFEQFQRLANTYFLVLALIQFAPFSPVHPVTTLVPLSVVLIISAFKDATDDLARHKSDNINNSRLVSLLRGGILLLDTWENVRVGDIVYLEGNDPITADLVVISSSEPHGYCFIETAELDGETNLKVRCALPATAKLKADHTLLAAMKMSVDCEAPNNNLTVFEGVATVNGGPEEQPLDLSNVVLRGCTLRNTAWLYGLVVYAGPDTKIMQNTGAGQKLKKTHIDKLINLITIGIMLFLVAICFVCATCCVVWEELYGKSFEIVIPWEFNINSHSDGAVFLQGLITFGSYLLLLNTLLPVSLYVTIEGIRFVHSYFINVDLGMYYSKTDKQAHSNTTTLNEELGQVQYVFSDKTGTLTQNEMHFRRCSIRGLDYGDDGLDDAATSKLDNIDFTTRNMFADSQFEFRDRKLLDALDNRDEFVCNFFLCLSLCHTVIADGDPDDPTTLYYKAQSPDEGALVNAAKNFGYVYRSRTPNTINIYNNITDTDETYELRGMLEFTNERKRMSVVVQAPLGQYYLFTKGADSVVSERLSKESLNAFWPITVEHMMQYAGTGLRTLCVAYRQLDEREFRAWDKKYKLAQTAKTNRAEELAACYDELEHTLELLGVSALEDKLQDCVPDTLANLHLAGIKVWILTGDKTETAINIAYSCSLLSDETKQYLLDSPDRETTRGQLEKIKREMTASAKVVPKPNQTLLSTSNSAFKIAKGILKLPLISEAMMPPSSTTPHAIIATGQALLEALEGDMAELFADVSTQCSTVVCCRVAPLQKAQVVELIRSSRNVVTLAIGDGGNDVSMIKTADIGVGISGLEGNQAALASDYNIGQFKFLNRLLFVHGRWSYLRMCVYLKYFFLKNFVFSLCHFWFAFFCGFTANKAVTEDFITLFNICHTSWPCLCIAFFNQDLSAVNSEQFPKLYTPGLCDLGFNPFVFSEAVFESFFVSASMFFTCYLSFANSDELASQLSFEVALGAILVVYATFRCALDTNYWTAFTHFVIWGSLAWYFAFTALIYSPNIDPDKKFPILDLRTTEGGVSVYSSTVFWFTLLFTQIVNLAPIIIFRWLQATFTPTLKDKLRLAERLTLAHDGDFCARIFTYCYSLFQPRYRKQPMVKNDFKHAVEKFHIPSETSERILPQRPALQRKPSTRTSYSFDFTPGFSQLLQTGKLMKGRLASPRGWAGQNQANNAGSSILHKQKKGLPDNQPATIPEESLEMQETDQQRRCRDPVV